MPKLSLFRIISKYESKYNIKLDKNARPKVNSILTTLGKCLARMSKDPSVASVSKGIEKYIGTGSFASKCLSSTSNADTTGGGAVKPKHSRRSRSRSSSRSPLTSVSSIAGSKSSTTSALMIECVMNCVADEIIKSYSTTHDLCQTIKSNNDLLNMYLRITL